MKPKSEKIMLLEKKFRRSIYDSNLLLIERESGYSVEKDSTLNHVGRKVATGTLNNFLSLYENVNVSRFEMSAEDFSEYKKFAESN